MVEGRFLRLRLFSDVASTIADPFLRRAAELAERGRGTTAPNPLVGCVVVRDGLVVGEGFHARAGQSHAEPLALEAAGEAARGATAYVTLEPCSHTGRTPPCTFALIEAGVSHVHFGMPDPSPEAGGGADILRAAGIGVSMAADPTPFEEINEGWLSRVQRRRPFVVVKVALSLDGRPALAAGERASITHAAGAEVTRLLRSRVDAVAVGAATVRIDDPSLTLRASDGALLERQPRRVVIMRGEAPPPEARIFADSAGPTLVLAPDSADEPRLRQLPSSVQVARYRADAGLVGALEAMATQGINEVLIEPGPRLLTSLWTENLLDVLVTVTGGGMAGADAPDLYLGHADRRGDGLFASAVPLETGVVGDVSVTVWRLKRARADRS
jgi:diaminohydroxyphosphoribosylaminopyrimidine deaminase/5-amino-6-(5-phosphoribosylamino)uracil reductase